jgi:hypothetical protein
MISGCAPARTGADFAALSQKIGPPKVGQELARFAHRRLSERFPYLVLDARYEKVRIDSVIQSQAVLIAVGIDWEGRRQVLGVELANRESRSSWRDFLMGLKERGLVRALAVEQHERWQEDHRYLNMAFLKEMQRDRLKTAA